LSPPSGRQLTLDEGDGGSWLEVADAVDEIRDRFGSEAIGPAVTMVPGGPRPKRRGAAQWGPSAPEGPGAPDG